MTLDTNAVQPYGPVRFGDEDGGNRPLDRAAKLWGFAATLPGGQGQQEGRTMNRPAKSGLRKPAEQGGAA